MDLKVQKYKRFFATRRTPTFACQPFAGIATTLHNSRRYLLSLLIVMGAMGHAFGDSYSSPMMFTSNFPDASTYMYAYIDFEDTATDQVIPANCFLEYDVYIPNNSADFCHGIDMFGPNWVGPALRDWIDSVTNDYIRDQNYLRAHPFEEMIPYGQGTWYHRQSDFSALAGQKFREVCIAADTGNGTNGSPQNLAGTYNAYVDNVHLTDAYGNILVDFLATHPHFLWEQLTQQQHSATGALTQRQITGSILSRPLRRV